MKTQTLKQIMKENNNKRYVEVKELISWWNHVRAYMRPNKTIGLEYLEGELLSQLSENKRK